MSAHLIAVILGWGGMIALLLAYWLISEARVSNDSRVYQGLNILGSLGLGIAALEGRVWPSVALNVVWILIGVATLIRVGAQARSRRRAPDAQSLLDAGSGSAPGS